jgi:three-Cys-motif partner protein
LYAGRGRYDDGRESTPLLVLRQAIENPVVSKILVTIFNDKDHAPALRAEIDALPRVKELKYKPVVSSYEIAADTAKLFEKIKLVPTLALLDPWGYKGLTRELIHSLLKDWGCDLIFFFNYNRINMGIENEAVVEHMEALFGAKRLARLRKKLPGLSPKKRERMILRFLRRRLREVGGQYVRPFKFVKPNGRTSHYLIFVSKKFKGVEIMRDVMANASSHQDGDGVASFSYDPRPVHRAFTRPEPKRLDRLQANFKDDLAGQSLTAREIFERHSRDGRFTFKNYQEALRRLEEAKEISVVRPTNRKVYAGKATMPPDARITILPQRGGPGIAASHSTPDHRAAARPPSASARPTA